MRVDRWFAINLRFPTKAEIYVLEGDGAFYAYGRGIFTQTPGLESRIATLTAPDGRSVPDTFRDPREILSPGQQEEISRVLEAYPHLNDDDFVREGLDRWLRP
jgi:hypothetical protein